MAQIYDRIGTGYARQRGTDPRIANTLHGYLNDLNSVLNIGAGTGSYEPEHLDVLAVEPSATMVAQRTADAAPVVRAVAGALPFADKSFDAAMAVLTLHHWPDWRAGLDEMRRVARQRLVILTFDAVAAADFWLMSEYFPSLLALDQKIMPPLEDLISHLGATDVVPVLVPHDCKDGFLGAYWRHPQAYLDPQVRTGMSSFAAIDPTAGLAQLSQDLASGRWEDRHGHLLKGSQLDIGYRLVIADLSARHSA